MSVPIAGEENGVDGTAFTQEQYLLAPAWVSYDQELKLFNFLAKRRTICPVVSLTYGGCDLAEVEKIHTVIPLLLVQLVVPL